MRTHIRPALSLLALFSLLTGVAYPLAITGIAQLTMPRQAAGSLITDNGTVVGSKLIGQSFVSEKYFHGRPSVAGNGYDAAVSSASNLGPTSAKLQARIAGTVAALKAENPSAVVPPELVYASASGLDPHLSPAAAVFQIPRIANARSLEQGVLQDLLAQHIQDRALGFLGEPTVNVLELNQALDAHAASLQSPQ